MILTAIWFSWETLIRDDEKADEILNLIVEQK